MATINEIKQQAASVKNATQVGENTAERVGGALAGLADIAEQQDTELGKKFDKENIAQEFGDSKDKVVSQFALPFREIESPEFIKLIVDAEDHFLFGIQLDGSIEWGKGIPTPIRTKLQEIINQCQKDKTDILEAINAAKEELSASIIALQEGKVDKEEGKSLIEDEVKECFRVIENEEFIKAIVDADNKVLFGFYRATGKPYYPQNDMYHISQSEEFLWVILDAANHPLLGIQQDGTCWAANAQWLDDIKAIKNVLSSIDETLKTFQPKEDGKGLINLDVADSFFYISNDEYIIAVVDAENRILAGIKYDGEPYFPNHEMYSVITNEEWLYATIDAENKVLGGFRANDGHMIVGGIDISTFIANAIIDVADIKERTAHLSTIVNDEYLSVETDADGKVIGYTAPDGSHYLYKVKSETIPTEFTHIEDPEGRTEITTDAEDKILGYRDSEGTLNEAKIAVNNLLIKNKKSFLDENRRNGFDVSPIDYSFETELHIPQPTCAKVNFSGIDNIPQEKFANVHGYMEFWDMNGNYFKKEVIMNAQGRSSLGFPKKNIAIDICNNNGFDDSDTFKLQIGDWVPQDSFHLKGYINDPFRGICPVSYKLYDEIVKTRGIFNDYVWKRAIVNTSNITETSNGAETQKETAKQFDTGARCFPDGFPCIVYLNNEFYGIYSWQLKKHRDNYHLEKKNANNIHLDGNITDASILNANGDASKIGWNALDVWHGFEIRNPKNLILMNGSKYDADFNAGELIDDSSSVYNPSDKNHILSSKVKKHILELSKVMTKLSDAKSTYDLSSKNNSDKEMFKSVFETYFDIDNLIDYLILSDVVRNADGFGDNWQWFTYNGVKWYIGLYDTDMILGNQAGLVQTIDPPLDHHVCQTYQYKYLLEFYTDELQARYKELRDIKIIDADHICNLLKEWMDRIGNRSVFEKEWNKWSVFVKNDSLYRVKKWLDNSIKNMDSIYKYNV